MSLQNMKLCLLNVNGVFLSTVTLFIRITPMQKKGLSLRVMIILYNYMQSSDVQILIPLSRKKNLIKATNTVLQIIGDQRKKID